MAQVLRGHHYRDVTRLFVFGGAVGKTGRLSQIGAPRASGSYGIVESNPHLKVTGLPLRPNSQLP